MKKCIFCGSDLIDNKCPNEPHFKPMCINCQFCNEENDKFYCINSENQADAIKKIKESVPSGYEIENITLKPLPLKDETKKCKRWNIINNFVELYIV